MRYEKGHKSNTRQRILETAATEFRKQGIDGISVATLMGKTGLTHGGFYSHFKSKEELVQESLQIAFPQYDIRQFRTDANALEKMIRHYLGTGHRDHPERGCAIAGFIGDMPRRIGTTRTKFSAKINGLVELMEEGLPEEIQGEARKKIATGIAAIILGTLQLARATTNPKRSDEILEAGIETALALAKA